MSLPRKARIVVVEDEPDLRADLVDYLNLRQFTAQGVATAGQLLELLAQRPANLVLLDIGLPDQSGLSLIPHLRRHHPALGIVMLTAYGDAQTRVASLETGADAYLVKGASLEVIEATCSALLRRLSVASAGHEAAPPADAHSHCEAAPWTLDTLAGQLHSPSGVVLELTLMECNFLAQLMAQPGSVVTRQAILAALERADTLSNLRNLDGCAARLRSKVAQELSLPLPVRSSYGRGYAFTGLARVIP